MRINRYRRVYKATDNCMYDELGVWLTKERQYSPAYRLMHIIAIIVSSIAGFYLLLMLAGIVLGHNENWPYVPYALIPILFCWSLVKLIKVRN